MVGSAKNILKRQNKYGIVVHHEKKNRIHPWNDKNWLGQQRVQTEPFLALIWGQKWALPPMHKNYLYLHGNGKETGAAGYQPGTGGKDCGEKRV